MRFKDFQQGTLRLIGNYSLFGSVSALCRSLKVTVVNKKAVEELTAQNKNYILAFWHGSMLVPWYLHRNKRIATLISKSKDGELLTKILKRWRYKVIRGSSSSGGDIALGILTDYAKNESSIAITPDGPRGPRHKLKAGAVVAAKKSGAPLVLMAVGYEKKKQLKSWDKFEIPFMFSRVKVIYSDPIAIDKNLSYEETSKVIENCEKLMNDLHDEANKF